MARPIVLVNDQERRCLVGSIGVNRKQGARDTAKLTLLDLDSTFRPEVGDTVRLFDGSQEVWAGIVSSLDEVSLSDGQTTYRRYAVNCVGWEHRLSRRTIYDYSTGTTASYHRNFLFTANATTNWLTAAGHGREVNDVVHVKTSVNGYLPTPLEANRDYWVRDVDGDNLKLSETQGGSIIDLTDAGDGRHQLITYRAGEIVLDLLDKYAGGAWPGQPGEEIVAVDIQLGALIDKAIFDGITVAEALDSLAAASNYTWWVDIERGLHFVPHGTSPAPFAITGDSRNYRKVSVSRIIESKCNDALARVAWSQFPVTEEMFAGDGVTREWSLTKPVAQVIYIRVNELVEEFVFGANAGQDYLIADGHTAQDDQQVRVREPVPGTLPPPLAEGVDYYARDVGLYPLHDPDPGSLRLANYPGGGAIDLTADGSGVLVVYTLGNWYEKTFGEDGVGADLDFYYSVGEMGIRQDGSRLPLKEETSVAVGYYPLGQNLIQYDDTDNIVATAGKEGGSGRYSQVIDRSDTGEGQVQALALAQTQVDKLKAGGTVVAYETDCIVEPTAKNLVPGQMQSIDLPHFGVTGEWPINEVTIEDREMYFAFSVRAVKSHLDWLDYYKALVKQRRNVGVVGAAVTGAPGGIGEAGMPPDVAISGEAIESDGPLYRFKGVITFPTSGTSYWTLKAVEVAFYGPLASDGGVLPDTSWYVMGTIAAPAAGGGNVAVDWTSDSWPRPNATEYWKIQYTKISKGGARYNNNPFESAVLESQSLNEAVPVPDVLYFKAGTVDALGTWTEVMRWDTLRQQMLIDWAVLAPVDRRNWSGAGMWIRVPKPGGGYYFFDTSGLIPVSSFAEKDGDVYYYGQHGVELESIPDPPETWRCIGVSYDANEQPKLDGDGNPTGPYVDLQTLAAWGQLTNLAATVAEYGYDETTEPGKPVARVEVTYTNPPDADEKTYFSFWIYVTAASVTEPPDAAKFEHRANMRWETERTDVDMWLDRPKQGDPTDRLWIRAVTCNEFYSGPPTNVSPVCYVDITAAGVAAQVTGFSVIRQDIDSPAKTFRLVVNYTRPVSLEFFVANIERIACDSNYNPLAGQVWGIAWDVGAHATPGVATSEVFGGPWVYPPTTPIYWKARAISVSRAGIRNETNPPTSNWMEPTVATIPGSKVVDIPTASFAATIEPVGLVTAAADANGNLWLPKTVNAIYNIYDRKLYRWDGVYGCYRRRAGAGDFEADSVTAGIVSAGAIRTRELAGNEIVLGGWVADKPPRLKVVDGDDSTTLALIGKWEYPGGVWWRGGYFKNIWIGPSLADIRLKGSATGLDITNAAIQVTGPGNTVIVIGPTVGFEVSSSQSGYKTSLREGYLNISSTYPSTSTIVYPGYLGLGWGLPDWAMLSTIYGGGELRLEGGGFAEIRAQAAPSNYIHTTGDYRQGAGGGTTMISTGGEFVGKGVSCQQNYVGAMGFRTYLPPNWHYGVTGTFTANGKTIYVAGGIITGIV